MTVEKEHARYWIEMQTKEPEAGWEAMNGDDE